MAIENEVIGEINKEIFDIKISEFINKFGEPKIKKRLGIMVFDRNNPNVDTRIRITNGEAEIMQKVTKSDDKTGHSEKEEISIKISNDIDTVFNAFLTYSNLLKEKYGSGLIRLLVQTENYLWKTDKYELKLSLQFGKNDYYTFEVEALSEDCDVKAVQSELGLIPTENHASPERKEFRTTKVDLSIDDLDDDQIKGVISKYFNN